MLECVVNVSEGRDAAVLRTLAEACGPALLDLHTDADHHRSVFTLAGEHEPVTEALERLVAAAIDDIDMDAHDGEHPRIGAVDVIPFIPLAATTMDDCVAVATAFGALPFAFTISLVSLSVVRPSMVAAARDLGASYWRAFRDITLPLVRGGIASTFVFSFLLSFNEYARAYYLVGRQNTLPLAMFGAMNSGTSPTIYALSGAILVVSFALVGTLLGVGGLRARRRAAGSGE